jgi:hypothetical protein
MSTAAVPEKAPDDSSKLKTFLSILRKYVSWGRPAPPFLGANMLAIRFVGVADIASVRFSLPAQLLEPRPNLGRSLLC